MTVEEYLSLQHPNASNPDDTVQLALGTIGVTVTATDGDGDHVTSGAVDVSHQITFHDDGPTLGTIQPIETDDDPTDTNATIKDGQGSLHLASGADGFGSVTITPDLDGLTVGGKALVGHQTGNVFTAFIDANGNGSYDAGDTFVGSLHDHRRSQRRDVGNLYVRSSPGPRRID